MNAPRNGSSHYTFSKNGCKPIKKVYVEMVKQRIIDVIEVKSDLEWADYVTGKP